MLTVPTRRYNESKFKIVSGIFFYINELLSLDKFVSGGVIIFCNAKTFDITLNHMQWQFLYLIIPLVRFGGISGAFGGAMVHILPMVRLDMICHRNVPKRYDYVVAVPKFGEVIMIW